MKQLIFVFFIFLFSMGSMYVPVMAQQHELTLMTYNIFHGENPYVPGESNLSEIGKLITDIKPDLVAFQEVDSMTNRSRGFGPDIKKDIMQELEKLTGMKGVFAKAITYSEGGYGEGVLSSLPMDFRSFQLPSPAGGEGRSMAVALVKLKDGQEVVFAGTHLCHEFEENRTAQVEAILNILSKLDLPVVLTGDFNFTTDEKGYALLSENYTDAAAAFGNPLPTYPSEDPKIRLDYFWLSGNTDWKIAAVNVLDVAFSDHRPVVLQVKF